MLRNFSSKNNLNTKNKSPSFYVVRQIPDRRTVSDDGVSQTFKHDKKNFYSMDDARAYAKKLATNLPPKEDVYLIDLGRDLTIERFTSPTGILKILPVNDDQIDRELRIISYSKRTRR